MNIRLYEAIYFGFASFFTPCMFQIVPGYLSYLMGSTISEMEENRKLKIKLWINTIGFLVGLTIVFVLLGMTATAFSRIIIKNQNLLQKISGIIIIFFGVFQLGIVNIRFLNIERRGRFVYNNLNFLKSIVIGATFAFSWTPCVGPLLTAILALAANKETVLEGGYLLFMYSIGFCVPFLVISLLAKYSFNIIKRASKYLKWIKLLTGAVLIIIGLGILLT